MMLSTVLRDLAVWRYEIAEWHGDPSRPNIHTPLTADRSRRKMHLLSKHCEPQLDRDWWGSVLFLSLLRLHRVECRPRYAEASYLRRSFRSMDD
jgi:hypothetical protein